MPPLYSSHSAFEGLQLDFTAASLHQFHLIFANRRANSEYMNHIDITAFHGKACRSNFPPLSTNYRCTLYQAPPPRPPQKVSSICLPGDHLHDHVASFPRQPRACAQREFGAAAWPALHVCARLADMLICVCVWDNIQSDAAGGHYVWDGTVYYVHSPPR